MQRVRPEWLIASSKGTSHMNVSDRYSAPGCVGSVQCAWMCRIVIVISSDS